MPCILFVFVLVSHFFSCVKAQEERQVVFFLEESFNTRSSIAQLQDGIGRFFDFYAGRSNKFMFHVYRTSYPENLERVISTRDPNSLSEAFRVMTANPAGPQDCERQCCCNSLLFNYLPSLLDLYPGALIVSLVDCHYDLSEQPRLELLNRIHVTKTTLVVFRQQDSYCTSIRGKTTLTDFTFDLDSQRMGDIFAVLLAFYNSQKLSAQYSQLCDNQTLSAHVFSTTQAVAVILARGRLTYPMGLYDDQPYTKNVVAHLDNGISSQIIVYYADCEPNWEFAAGYCFLRQRLATTWTRADAACRARNATLISPFAAQADAFFTNDQLWEPEVVFGDETTWMSVEDFNSKKSFRWLLADPDQYIELANLNYSAWAPNQPTMSIPPGNRCVVLDRKTRQWKASLCSSFNSYTCVKPAYTFNDESSKHYIASDTYRVEIDSYSECSFSIFSLK